MNSIKRALLFFVLLLSVFFLQYPSLTGHAQQDFDWSAEVNGEVSINKVWTITFNQKLLIGDLIYDKIYILDSKGNKVQNGYSYGQSGDQLYLYPPREGYIPSEVYTMYISKEVMNLNGASLKKPVEKTFRIRKSEHISESGKILDQIVTLPKKGYVDIVEAQNIKRRLAEIPNGLLNGLKNKGIEIRLINGKLTDEPELRHLAGVVPRGWEGTGLTWDDVPGAGGNPTFVKIGHSNMGMGHGSVNLELHETAHIIDRAILNLASSAPLFKAIQQAEKDQLFGTPYYVYPEEFFAESFAYYYFSAETRNTLKQKAPRTYDYFMRMEQDFTY